MAMKVGGTAGKLVTIDWRDKDGDWVEFIGVRVKVDTAKTLWRVTNVVGKCGKELLCFFKYERLLVYCYICGQVKHTTKKYAQYSQDMSTFDFEYWNWLRVKLTL